jgi:hypothetical protein
MKRRVILTLWLLPCAVLATQQGSGNGESGRAKGLVNPALYVEEVSSGGTIMASSDTALECMKTLQKKGIRVVTIKEKADFVVQITRQLGKKSWSKDTKLVMSNRDGEVVLANSTRSIGGAADDIAEYIRKRNQ